MDKKDYLTIKAFLKKHDFKNPVSFTNLYKSFNNSENNISFKLFVKYCQALGVSSVVRRLPNGNVRRFLIYEPQNDKQITLIFTQMVKCEACSGKGYIQKTVNLTD